MESILFASIKDQLLAKKSSFKNYLEQIRIKNLRGIRDLSVTFEYPVSVIAGPNACGKSTVLFACACAYEPLNGNPRNFTPASLFPNLNKSKNNQLSDKNNDTSFEFYYRINKQPTRMQWAKGKSWNKSYMGQKDSKQPQSDIYFRTLANLTSPSEVRSVLQIANSGKLETENLTADLLAFAQTILSINYADVYLLKNENKDLLHVKRDDIDNTSYSEFHMSAGERAILRISKDISQLKNALVLIDEIETGLHPYTQKLLMLELQRIAVRNELQIIVTTHSPVVIESVPEHARVFLERTEDNVIEKPAYKNIIQKALYGQSTEKLSILCEDIIGEHFVLGVLDYLNPKLNLSPDDFIIGRDTGKDEFSAHITALGKFSKLRDFIFVLDGDARDLNDELIQKAAKVQSNATIEPLFLPGTDIPETWAWNILIQNSAIYAELFGIGEQDFRKLLTKQNSLYDSATDKPTKKAKNKFSSFCSNQLRRQPSEVMRMISKTEITNRQTGEIKIFADTLERLIGTWQSRK